LAMRRELERRKRADAALRQVNIELERRVAERTAELSAATRRLQFALEGARLGAWSVDLPDGRFWCDEASKAMQGVEPDHPINSVEEAKVNIHPDDQMAITARFKDAIQNHVGFECEYRVIMPDGDVRWIVSRGQVVYSDPEEARPFKMFGITQDITERKRAEAALRESETRFRTLAETANDAIITIDESGMIIFVNPATEKVFGYGADEMIGRPLTMLMPEYLRHLHQVGFKRYKQTGERHIPWDGIELPGLHKNGSEIPLEITFGEFSQQGRRYFTG